MPPPPPPPPLSPFPPSRPNWWQRNWRWFVPAGCFSLLVLFLGFIGVIVLVATTAMKSSDAYKVAVARAKADPRVVRVLGEPVREGMFTSGNVNVSGGAGQADFKIPLSGPRAKGTLYAVATKSAGEWTYSTLTVKVEGSEETVDFNER